MNRLPLSLIFVLACYGCATAPQMQSARPNSPLEQTKMREFGVSVLIPDKTGYVNWNAEHVTMLLHPRVAHPVSDTSYAVSIEMLRPSEVETGVWAERVAKGNPADFQIWDLAFHESLQSRESGGVVILRRDIRTWSGRIITLRAVVYARGPSDRFLHEAEDIIRSVAEVDQPNTRIGHKPPTG